LTLGIGARQRASVVEKARDFVYVDSGREDAELAIAATTHGGIDGQRADHESSQREARRLGPNFRTHLEFFRGSFSPVRSLRS
jgi:hypothetical protein